MKSKKIIKNNYEFQNIISKKQAVENSSFIIYFQKGDKDFLRYGISVGKKLGNAVLRNKIKRQMRMMMIQNINLFDKKNFEIIIIARKGMFSKTFQKNSQLLINLIKSIK